MAHRTERNGEQVDIVIDGFEKGIADSPELGIADIRNANIISVPSEAGVSFATTAGTVPPTGQTGLSYSAAASTDVFTVSDTTGYYDGMAVSLDTVSVTTTVAALVVGGGGAGGSHSSGNSGSGGGGAGGYQYNSAFSVSVAAYPITVGTGGTSSASQDGGNGTDSTFSTITATGGGGGGKSSGTTGVAGGSGGGAPANGTGSPYTGGAGTAGQGHDGGGTAASSAGFASGGGGATAAGGAGTSGGAGNGGAGTANSISGASVTYAGGGGGGSYASASSGSGGAGGGGAGGNTGGENGTAGTANTGGGGGGAGYNGSGTPIGGNGGSGVVIISYTTGALTATGGTITTSGGNTIHTFNSSGTFTVSAINIQAGQVLYVGNLTATTFKLYKDLSLQTLVDVLHDTTGTYSVPSFGTAVWGTQTTVVDATTGVPDKYTFLIDNTGKCWFWKMVATTGTGGTIVANALQFAANSSHSATVTNADFGIVAWKGYVFVMIGVDIDYLLIQNLFSSTGPYASWVYAWKSDLTKTSYQHQAIAAVDDAVYFCNGDSLGSLIENVGTTFDPTSSSTYTYNAGALVLPSYDQAQCLAQLGVNLYIGGIQNYIYPWDRSSTQFSYPLIVAETNIVRIVSTNSNAYVFAGNRGRIYITNGAQIELFKKIPDSLSSTDSPYYTWGDAIYFRNQVYFSLTATNNAGTAISNFAGIWGFDVDSKALRLENQLSYATYAGSVPVILPMISSNQQGNALYSAWVDGSSNTGIDASSTSPYTNYETYIDTDIIPVGTYFNQKTDTQVEYKVSKPLVSGEAVKIAWRGNLTDSFTDIPISEGGGVGTVSGAARVNFQQQQWAQFRISFKSTASSPSYTRLREMRLR